MAEPRAARLVGDVLLGLFGGAVVSAGIGLSQVVATGLTMGIRIGMDGSAQSTGSPAAPWIVGLFVFAFSGLLYASRGTWWTPVVARIAAIATVTVAVCIGIIMFDGDYVAFFGTHPWYRAIPIEMSRSVATYAFLGVSVVSLLTGFGRSRDDSAGKGTSSDAIEAASVEVEAASVELEADQR